MPQLFKKNKLVHIPTAAQPEPPTVNEIVTELKTRLHPLDFSKHKALEPQTQHRNAFREKIHFHRWSWSPSNGARAR